MLLGRYEILETIGQGATSTVAKARDTLIGRVVALKTLQPGLTDSGWRERFLAEARIVGQLSHPSIVNLYDVGIEEATGSPYLVMEFVVGQTLERLLEAGSVRSRHAFTWGVDLARALDYAHRHGVIHGDVKPANILVSEDARVKLTDFGIARWATRITQTGSLRGTPAFLSPEQIENLPTDGRSDLFSLGIVLYQMATGRRAFLGDSMATVCAQILKAKVIPPSQVNPELPAELDRVLLRCLAKSPGDRYADGEELAKALEGVARKNAGAAARAKAPAALALKYGVGAALLGIALSATFAASVLRQRLQVLPAPPAVFAAPQPPAELRPAAPAGAVATASLEPVAAAEDAPPKSSAAKARQSAPPAKSAAAAAENSAPAPLSKPAAPSADAAEATRRSSLAQLTIEIAAARSDDTLAVFADRQLLFTTSLEAAAGKEGEPFRTVFPLAPGQHHLSVALYKGDKTLRSEKEGLAELRKGTANVLTIRVTKRSKFMPLRGPGLKITWPGETSASEREPGPTEPASKASASKF